VRKKKTDRTRVVDRKLMAWEEPDMNLGLDRDQIKELFKNPKRLFLRGKKKS